VAIVLAPGSLAKGPDAGADVREAQDASPTADDGRAGDAPGDLR